MATIITKTLFDVEAWDKSLPDTCDNSFETASIQQGVREFTNRLVLPFPLYDSAEKIIQILGRQASKLKEKKSDISFYIEKIERVLEDAKTNDAAPICERIEDLRLKGYDDHRIFPRNEEEVRKLIDAKTKLIALRTIFRFCLNVEKILTNEIPHRIIKTLVNQSDDFKEKKDDYRALQIALERIETFKASPLEIPKLFTSVDSIKEPTYHKIVKRICCIVSFWVNSFQFMARIPSKLFSHFIKKSHPSSRF